MRPLNFRLPDPACLPVASGSRVRSDQLLRIAAVALLATGVMAGPSCSQSENVAPKDAKHEEIIVSGKPAQQSRVQKLLSRLLGRREKLKTTDSEVVSVPK